MTSRKVVQLKLDTYIAALKNGVGSRMFRNFYATVDGKQKDIMRNGDLSCAFYASFVLAGFSMIKTVHGTVGGTVADLRSSGWERVRSPRPGCVVVWGPKTDEKGESHRHIGFYIGGGKAVSNSSKKRSPTLHSYKNRKVTELYWNPRLR